jgi:hypothetical protein
MSPDSQERLKKMALKTLENFQGFGSLYENACEQQNRPFELANCRSFPPYRALPNHCRRQYGNGGLRPQPHSSAENTDIVYF